ncbi:MAG: type II secretion system protein [Gemmiger sp.]|uniref:type II secretion system protein n=1 Tax=Gemmiger sp. TaxID=2049027 RepID=UPI00284229A2|nr:type II secretion system protein [Gemmiger sp.]MDR4066744.1 type II secretion system protein [Gemmiger sp.]
MSLLNLLEEFIMFEKIRKMKNKKGFTLVELIVDLVILAILAALLVPALTGYIDKANKEKVIAECRMAVMAIQTESTSIYGEKGKVETADLTKAATDKAIRDLAEVSGFWAATVDESGKVTEVKYSNANWTVTYTAATGSAAAGYNTPEQKVEVTADTYNAAAVA